MFFENSGIHNISLNFASVPSVSLQCSSFVPCVFPFDALFPSCFFSTTKIAKKLPESLTPHDKKSTIINMFASSQHLVQHQRFSSALASTSRARNNTSKRAASPRANAVAVVGTFFVFSLSLFRVHIWNFILNVIRDVLRVSREASRNLFLFSLSDARAVFFRARARERVFSLQNADPTILFFSLALSR